MNILNTIKNIYKKNPKVVLGLSALIILGIGWFGFSGSTTLTPVTVARGDVMRVVTVTGKIVPVRDAKMGFEQSGRVSKINAAVGSSVRAGDPIVTLENGDAYADLAQAEANIAAEKARLNELVPQETNGGTLLDAKQNLIARVQDAYAKADDAVRNYADQLFSNGATANPFITISVGNPQAVIDINDARARIEQLLVSWHARLVPGQIDTQETVSVSRANLEAISTFLNQLSVLANAEPGTTSTTARTAVSSARAQVATALSNLIGASEKLTSTQADVGAQGARVALYQAQALRARAQIEKTIIRAPFAGVVIQQDAKVGETVSPGVVLVTVMSHDPLHVEANVPEVHIGTLAIGNAVAVYPDAFPDTSIPGLIATIDPGETVVQGVANYKVTASLGTTTVPLRSGLTARIDITTGSKKNVLILPLFAVGRNDMGAYVRVLEGKTYKDVPVVTGLTGSSGTIEIVSGITEGQIVVPINK